MAYLIGRLTVKEEAELKRRGWQIEDAPPVDLDTNELLDHDPDQRMRKVWVDSSMFEVMNGPDWDKGKAH